MLIIVIARAIQIFCGITLPVILFSDGHYLWAVFALYTTGLVLLALYLTLTDNRCLVVSGWRESSPYKRLDRTWQLLTVGVVWMLLYASEELRDELAR